MNLEINNKTKQRINNKILQRATDVFSNKFKTKQKEVSLALVGEKKIKDLNKQYRQIDKVTDILSFADGENNFLGELIICPQKIKRQAKERQTSFQSELVFIFIHGLLHLVGYNDHNNRGHEKMMKIGKQLTTIILKK